MSYAAPGMLTSLREHWNTPEKILAPVRLLDPYGRGIGIDPCSSPSSKVKARINLCEWDDGLSYDWRGYGLVYMNAPYGKPLPVWCAKLYEEFRFASKYGSDDHAISLVPARPDTRWWHNYCAKADLVCFIKGRLRFEVGVTFGTEEVDSKKPGCVAPFPSALVYYGRHAERVRRILQPLGWIP